MKPRPPGTPHVEWKPSPAQRRTLSRARKLRRAGRSAEAGEIYRALCAEFLPRAAASGKTSSVKTSVGVFRVTTLGGHRGKVWWADVSDASRLIASGAEDGVVRVWDRGLKLLRELHGHSDWVHQVTFSRDGKLLASAGGDERVNVWRTEDGRWERSFDWPCHAARTVAFHPTEPVLAAGADDGTATLFNLKDGSRLAVLRGHEKLVKILAFSPDGTRLATASHDGTVGIWDWRAGKKLRALGPHPDKVDAVSFSPDGRRVAVGCEDFKLYVWSLPAGKLERDIEGHGERSDATAFANAGRWIASGSLDGTARLWNAATGAPLAVLVHHKQQGVHSVAATADGRRFVTAGLDGVVKVWDRR